MSPILILAKPPIMPDRRAATQILNQMAALYRFRVERVDAFRPQCDRSVLHSTMYYCWIGQQRIYVGSCGWERDKQRSREIAARQAIHTLLNMGYMPV